MNAPTVAVEGLSKSYGSTPALTDVNLSISSGVTGLLGPNGAGKTTLLRIVATVLAADAGRVRVLGEDPSRDDGRLSIRRRLGYFPQEPGYYQNFTAFEFVDYIAILKEMNDRRARHDDVRRVLSVVGLDDVMHKKIKKLSGGMRRRVIVAQALLGQPELLVLDEPTAGLDPEQRLRFREVVSSIAERQTVMLATHQTEDVAAMCQKVMVIDRGSVLFNGTPTDLTAQARGQVWLSDQPDPAAKVSWRTATGEHRVVGHEPHGAVAAEPTLEDGYLLLIGHTPDTGQQLAS
jgi:ABC-2 type transport system ATP-binding protein